MTKERQGWQNAFLLSHVYFKANGYGIKAGICFFFGCNRGKLCNKPFRITTIAIKSGTADEISAIMSEKKDK